MTITYRKLLPTAKASDYLRATHGFTITRSTLETLRCRGGGPTFVKVRGRVYYREPDLDEWLTLNTLECQNTSCYQALTATP